MSDGDWTVEELEDAVDHESAAALRRRTAGEHRGRKNLDRDMPEIDEDGVLVEDEDEK